MVARYKLKRLRHEMDWDSPPKNINLEGIERQRGKREVEEGLEDAVDINYIQIRAEIQWEEESRIAEECYRMEKADPNYRCTCYRRSHGDQ